MVGGYLEDLKKQNKNCQNWGLGTCAGMGACLGQYSTYKGNGLVTFTTMLQIPLESLVTLAELPS